MKPLIFSNLSFELYFLAYETGNQLSSDQFKQLIVGNKSLGRDMVLWFIAIKVVIPRAQIKLILIRYDRHPTTHALDFLLRTKQYVSIIVK